MLFIIDEDDPARIFQQSVFITDEQGWIDLAVYGFVEIKNRIYKIIIDICGIQLDKRLATGCKPTE